MRNVNATGSQEWARQAACQGKPLDLFDDYGPGVTRAKRLCATCPVKTRCLTDHLGEPWGIWGGLTTPERRAVQAGIVIRPCPQCGHLFARSRSQMCAGCAKTPDLPIGALRIIDECAGDGMKDRDIARKLREEMDSTITETQVRSVRRHHGIAPASRVQDSSKSKNSGRYNEKDVETVETAGVGFGELTTAEQAELLRRWLARGGTRSSFCHRFGCSGARVNQLRDAGVTV